MKDANVFSCTAFVCADPEVKTMSNGESLCTSRVGVNRMKEGETDWFSVKIWGKGGETFGKYMKKGSRVFLSGRIQIEEYKERLYPTIYVNDFTFLGGGKPKTSEEVSQNDDDDDDDTAQNVTEDVISEEEIPF